MKLDKRRIKKIIIFVIIITGVVLFYNNYHKKYTAPYSQEYTIGQGNIQGNVDSDKLTSRGKEFAIGANKYGYAVFKDPDAAFKRLKKDYKTGINAIQKEFNLLPLSQLTYEGYGVYGWQVTTNSEKEREEAMFVTQFMDIYENSYK